MGVGADPLVTRARQGDRAALEELCRREWRPIYGLIYRSVREVAEAQDLTQEVFLRALRAFDRYQDRGVPFHAFLAQVARNLLRDRWRRHKPALVELDLAGEIASGLVGPEDQVVASDERAELLRALAILPEDHRLVLRLRLIEGRTSEEVAQLMGRSPGAIRQLQRRALVALRDALREESRR